MSARLADRMSVVERLIAVGTASGCVGLWLVYPPLAFLLIGGVAYSLAALVDRRTVVHRRERGKGVT